MYCDRRDYHLRENVVLSGWFCQPRVLFQLPMISRRPGAWNLCREFAFFIGTEEAVRSVLRALSTFQHLNHLPAASPSPQLHRAVTIAATKSGLARSFIGGCDSARWLA